ncbi:M23 family metallopeptidase [Paraburkholderia hospita]|uniref:M23 family metallopeptidase n=1 Tax=Paraburkholderia hospita TaxID=169430 RepID=UPI003ECEEDEF
MLITVLGACHGHGDSSGSIPSSTATPATSVTGQVDANGGTITLAGVASVTFPGGVFPSPTTVTLQRVDDPTTQNDFDVGMATFGITESESFALKIDVATSSLPDLQGTARIIVSDDLANRAGQGSVLAAFAKDVDASTDEDKGETLDVYDFLDGQFDAQQKALTFNFADKAFASDFSDNDGHVAAVVRVAVMPPVDSGTAAAKTTSSLAQVQAKAATSVQCPGDASFSAPLLYGWRAASPGDPNQYYDSTVAGLIGTFGEGRPNHLHGGLDFFAEKGTPVFAVADGYIARLQHQWWLCPTRTKALRQRPASEQKNIPWPEYTLTLFLDDGSSVIYRHLSYNSVVLDGQLVGGNLNGSAPPPEFAQCWDDGGRKQYRVKAGQPIALTGETGTLYDVSRKPIGQVPPHLHLEWLPKRTVVSNPLCKLTSLYPLDQGSSPEPSALSTLTLFGHRAPGTRTVDVQADTYFDVQFRVRRNKSAAATPCYGTLTGTSQPCDKGGKGFFGSALEAPIAGSSWPKDSDGPMATPMFSSSNPSFINVQMIQYPCCNTVGDPHVTPPPAITVTAPLFTTSAQASCGASGTYTYTVSVIADKLGNTAMFGQAVTGSVNMVPSQAPYNGTGCAPVSSPPLFVFD